MLELILTDLDLLPDQILPAAKAHCRVDFDRDDQYIRGAIGRAIGEVESATNISVNPCTYRWNGYRECGGRGEIPKTPCRAAYYFDDTGARVDVALLRDENRAWLPDARVVRYYWVTDPGKEYFLECGYSDFHQITPVVMNAILFLTGTLYENRESLQFGSINELPDMTRRLLSGLWRPSV